MDDTFCHGPQIGDVIYSLPVVRKMGGGILYLDCSAEPAYRGMFLRSLTFLRRQPYVGDCLFHAGQEYAVDLDKFRHVPELKERKRFTLVASHFKGIGLSQPDSVEPWLTAATSDLRYPVIVHRSPRHRAAVDYGFLARLPAGDLYCVGSQHEAAYFEREFGAKHLLTPTLDKLASVLSGCQVFVGNQSAPLAVAVGLGKPRLLEEDPLAPNCTFGTLDEGILAPDAEANFAALCRLGYQPS